MRNLGELKEEKSRLRFSYTGLQSRQTPPTFYTGGFRCGRSQEVVRSQCLSHCVDGVSLCIGAYNASRIDYGTVCDGTRVSERNYTEDEEKSEPSK